MEFMKLNEAREFFAKDLFASQAAGIIIEAVGENYAKCSMKIESRHLNAMGAVMGGAIFTLADFTFAVASNNGNPPTVSLTSQISYLSPLKGTVLISEAKCIKSGRSTCCYVIDITDDMGNMTAQVSATGFRKSV